MTESSQMPGQETRTFHIGDLLSVTTGVLVSPRYMEGLSDIVSFLTGADLDLDRLPESLQTCRAYILTQIPALEGIVPDDVNFESWRGWLDSQEGRFGEWQPIQKPLPGQISLPG